MTNIFSSSIQKIRTVHRNNGAQEIFLKILHRLRIISVNHAFNLFYGEFHPLLGVGVMGTTQWVGVEGHRLALREISREEAETLTYADDLHYKDGDASVMEDLQEQFSKGLRFFAAFDKETIVALSGVHTAVADFVYVNKPNMPLQPGVVYFNAALTSPRYRNLGIGTMLRRYLFGAMQLEGYVGALSATFLENRGAARWHLANGFRRWGRIRYVRFLGKDICWVQRTSVGRAAPHLIASGKYNGSIRKEIAVTS